MNKNILVDVLTKDTANVNKAGNESMIHFKMFLLKSYKENIKQLCNKHPDILIQLAYTMCHYTFAKVFYNLDRLMYLAQTYKELSESFDEENDELPDILDKYKQDSKYLFKWHFENSKLKVDPEPIVHRDLILYANRDKDNILRCFFERAFNYPGSKVYCKDILEISIIDNAAFWHNCNCINQLIIDSMYN